MKTLDLSTLGIDNRKEIPIGYEKDARELYLEQNKEVLEDIGLPLTESVQKLKKKEFNLRLNALRAKKIAERYDVDIYPSSDSEDNDSNEDSSDDE
jgi:hypothetical protein